MTTNTVEEHLRQALADLADSRSTDAEERLRAIDYRPRSNRTQRWPILGATGTVLAAGAATAVVLLSSTTAPAFAGWAATPAAATAAALTTATGSCNNTWDRDAPSTMSPGQAVLSETRGEYTAAIYIAGDKVYDCISAGTPQSTAVGQDGPAPAQPDASDNSPGQLASNQISAPIGGGGSAPGFPGADPNGPLPQRWQRALSSITDPSQRAQQLKAWRNALVSGVEYHYLGLAGSSVSSVTLNFADGLTVDATVENGWYFAWWPTPDTPTSIEVTTSSGTTTSQLGPLGGAQCEDSSGCVFSSATA